MGVRPRRKLLKYYKFRQSKSGASVGLGSERGGGAGRREKDEQGPLETGERNEDTLDVTRYLIG